MFLEYLQTKGIFACHCTIKAKTIEVGLLILNGFRGGIITLVHPETKTQYCVNVEENKDGMYTEVTMIIV